MRPLRLPLLLLLLATARFCVAAGGGSSNNNGDGRRFDLEIAPEKNAGADWNTFHRWRLTARAHSSQQPPELAIEEIRFDGRMPQHRHGFAVQPRVSRIGPGVFFAEGVRFHMPGEWELEFAVRDATGWERLVIPFTVTAPLSPKAATAPPAGWSSEDWAKVRALSLDSLGPVPADPGNRATDPASPHAHAAAALELGRRLFFDPKLSGNGRISCATCHQPERFFTDGKALGVGIAGSPLARHTPTVVGVAYGSWFFWDGRRDSLWSQALGPLESPAEMGSSREKVARYLAADPRYRAAFKQIFTSDPAAAPVDETFANTGKAIAAWEASLRPARSRFDRFAAGEAKLTASEEAGLRLFISNETGCLRCHNGPLFTNHQFHNIGTGQPLDKDAPPDFGRLIGLQALSFDSFRCGSPYSDTSTACASRDFAGVDNHGDLLEGAFKVPTLRQIGQTAPYFHDGRYATLLGVLRHYREPPPSPLRRHELTPLPHLTDRNLEQLAAFLQSLSPPAAIRTSP